MDIEDIQLTRGERVFLGAMLTASAVIAIAGLITIGRSLADAIAWVLG